MVFFFKCFTLSFLFVFTVLVQYSVKLFRFRKILIEKTIEKCLHCNLFHYYAIFELKSLLTYMLMDGWNELHFILADVYITMHFNV